MARYATTGRTRSPLAGTFADAESTYYRSEFDSTRVILKSALAAAQAQGDSAASARALMWLGLTEYKQGDFASARRIGEQALGIKERLHLTSDLSQSYNALGLATLYQGRYSEAETWFTRALDTAVVAHDSVAATKAIGNLALVWTDLGDFPRARGAYEQTLRAHVARGDKRSAGNALANLGMLDIRVGDPAHAVRVLTEARALFDTLRSAPGVESTLGQLAEAYRALGDPTRAFAYTDSALVVARRYGLRQQQVDGLRHKAALYFDAGDLQRSLDYFEQSKSLATTLGLEEVLAEIAREEVRVLTALGEFDRAESLAASALTMHSSAGLRFEQFADRLLVAELAHRGGHRARAAEALAVAERESRGFVVGGAQVMLALTRARIADADGQPHRVLDALDLVRPELSRVDPGTAAEAFALRARSLARLGRLREAAVAGRQSVATLELIRARLGPSPLGASFVAQRVSVYGELVLVLLRLGDADGALQVADAARGRALLDQLTAIQRQGIDAAGPEAVVRGEALLDRIDALVARLAEADSVKRPERGSVAPGAASAELLAELMAARREYEEMLLRAEEADPRAALLLGAAQASAKDVRLYLEADEVLVEYLVTADRLFTFVVRRDGVTVLDTLCTPDAIAARVRLARDMIGRKSDAASDPVLTALHELLIAPAERRGLLRNARRIVLVPHGAMTYVPFAALRDTRSGTFLVEHYDILMLPSANAFVALRRQPNGLGASAGPPRSGAAVMAPFPDVLPGTQDEALSVARALGTRAMLGRDAGERAMRNALETEAVVHVATHAVLNERSPMFSRLELTRGSSASDDDGRFELHELLGTRIGSRLVFLSGCETALDPSWSTAFLRGEDYTTMAQAFLQAGASNVVATLWRIEDHGAAAFAAEFYRAFENHSPAASLALAQRAMIRGARYSEPYYWAAYQIEGVGDDAQSRENRRAVVR